MRILALAFGLPILVASAAAQSPQPGSPAAQNQNAAQSPQAIQQQVRKNLEQAGFTDIKLMPSSFLVRAKDKSGNPVMMVINPDSVTAVTQIPSRGEQTTGQGKQQPPSGTGPENKSR